MAFGINNLRNLKKKKWLILALFILVAVAYWQSLQAPIFHDSYSTVLNDREGNLLGATLAHDGQWRFPLSSSVPEKFAVALILTEDKRFYHHPGVDVAALARAIRQNLRAGKVISGGSTLSMQVIRLSRKNKPRTFLEKAIELIVATRLELSYSKKEILALYAAHAPFGGNVIGLEAACWRYFGRSPNELSWAEAATLAVLPNAPSLIHLNKNRKRLTAKRNHLLAQLAQAGFIDTLTLQLSFSEPIPEAPQALPRLAPHLLQRAIAEGKDEQQIISTLDTHIQKSAIQIVDNHYQRLKANQVFNASVIIAEIKTGNVLAYVGNTRSGKENNEDVDGAVAPRSTGSILKPFLFASMLHEGQMLPGTLWPDVPTFINGFAPKNFSKEYDGAVSAQDALVRSLNIPVVYELRQYRYEKFYDQLKNMGLTTLHQPADHYGLALILGGAEGTLWDITGAYASLARTLNHYFETAGKNRYSKKDFHPLRYYPAETDQLNEPEESSWLSAASIYQTFDVLKELHRPGEGTGWKTFSSTKKIAWKTGTSFGFRDAWAVGVNTDYAVGVWVGNADGEGRPNLIGTEAAAPLLFDLFSILPGNSWFRMPEAEMEKVAICKKSGHRATELCPEKDTLTVCRTGLLSAPCPYHKKIFLSKDMKFRVHSNCESLSNAIETSWFILPPIQEYYFKLKNRHYNSLPPFRKDCQPASSITSLDIIYPKPNSKVFVPIELDGKPGSALLEATHRNGHATIFWHLDGHFITTTQKIHKIELKPKPGPHILLLVDDSGEMVSVPFYAISGKKEY